MALVSRGAGGGGLLALHSVSKPVFRSAGHFATCCFPETDAQAPPALGIRVHAASRTALCLLLDFGDNRGAEMKLCTVTGAATVTGYYQYGTGMTQ